MRNFLFNGLPLLIGIIGITMLYALYTVGGGWQGGPDGCIAASRCFCEGFRDYLWTKQPANTWSNLSFILVGMAIGVRAGRRPHVEGNLMCSTDFYPVLYASLVSFLGPGSMALHASMTRWGGLVDSWSMFVYIMFAVFYAAARLRREYSPKIFVLCFVSASIVLSAFRIPDILDTELLFGISIVAAIGLEIAVSRSRKDLTRDSRGLWGAALLFLTAFAIWLPSNDGGPLCTPDSLFQGHVLWHMLTALSAGSLYLYYESERPVTSL